MDRPSAIAVMTDDTISLSAAGQGADSLLPLVYDELRKLAGRKLAQERPGQTLQARALVNEVYLRLVDGDPGRRWEGRAHFFAAAAQAMRRILVENARSKARQKRGGGHHRVDLADQAAPDWSEDLLALDEVMGGLATEDPIAAKVVELRPGTARAGSPVGGADPTIGLHPAADSTVAGGARPGGHCPALPAIEGYEILEELGRGGMGVVYKARQVLLNRPCALKMILGGALAGPDVSARFLGEAQAIARFHHPHIVQIHAIGEAEGLPFFELEHVEGGGLDKALDGTPREARRAARLVECLAGAVAEAHRLGIVHRDLKPANILLTGDGLPKIADFGLAKSLDDDSGLTATESIMGSPSYMAPEQAAGLTRQVGTPADIRSRGGDTARLPRWPRTSGDSWPASRSCRGRSRPGSGPGAGAGGTRPRPR